MSDSTKVWCAEQIPFAKAKGLLSDQVGRLKGPQLRKLMRCLSRLTAELRGQGVEPLRDYFSLAWLECHEETKRREIAAAERKDNGRVLFTVFHGRKYGWETQAVTIRTPHRLIEHKWYQDAGPYVSVAEPEKWLHDFRKANGIKEETSSSFYLPSSGQGGNR